MAKKNTARCTEITPRAFKRFLVGYIFNGQPNQDIVECHEMSISETGILTMLSEVDHFNEEIGAFNNWCFFREISDVKIDPGLKLPEKWGQIDGKPF